jgi:hypothetical protein
MSWRSDVLAGMLLYAVSALIVQIGFWREGVADPRDAAFHYDGGHYISLVERGYRYERERASNIAFFPGYPLIAKATGLPSRTALWLVAQLAFLLALVFFSAFLRTRPDLPRWPSLLALATWPPGVCFHVGYSESVLLALLALLMLGFAKGWSPFLIALIAGAATGVRAVGVAASAAAFLHIATTRGWKQAILCAPLTVWGLLGFMLYQAIAFDEPLAFLHTQRHWSVYQPEHAAPLDKALRLMILEPIWGSYVPGSQRHWSRFNEHDNPMLGSAFWNPVLFALSGVLVLVGRLKKWITREETLLAAGLLLIPYVTRADEQSMLSHARFAAVVLPMYPVMGKLLRRVPWVFAILAAGLALWASLFAADAPLL